jgi:putative hydrolase of the HAD superfamily
VPLLFLSLDNTLLDRAGAFRAWGTDFLAEIGVPAHEVDWLDSVDADGLTSAWDLADAIRARYRLRRRPIDLVEEIREGLLAHLRLDPLVAFALRIAVDAGWTPVVVTNGESRVQTDKMVRTGLAHRVAAYVISEDVGVRKPNPRVGVGPARADLARRPVRAHDAVQRPDRGRGRGARHENRLTRPTGPGKVHYDPIEGEGGSKWRLSRASPCLRFLQSRSSSVARARPRRWAVEPSPPL